ncbi:MAG: fibronectin type III domain-containing protein [Candidatus Nanoarchaeia archaeon]|jgi:hypothetical protein
MIKKFLLLTVFLLTISYGFSTAIYGYNNVYGYVNLTSGGYAKGVNMSLNCSSGIDTFINYKTTDINGFYSFEGIFNIYNSSALQINCFVNSTKKGIINTTLSNFEIFVHEGDNNSWTPYTHFDMNFTFNNTGNAIFDFSGLNGTLLSLDNEGVKNKTITLQCPNQINTTLTDEYGFYTFSGVSFEHNCTSEGCESLCNVSHLTEYNPFIIDSQGYYGETIILNLTENIVYSQNVKVNGAFFPSNGSYGNMTYFIFNASSYSGTINSCKYSNESKNFSSMADFNITSESKVFTANISTPTSGNYSYYVLCNTSLSVESAPRMVSYDVHLNGTNITINSPINGSVFSKNSVFNITLDIPAISCNYKINYDSNAHTMTNISSFNFIANQTGLIEGINNVTFSCTDYYSVVSSIQMNFTADITAPSAVESFSAKATNVGTAVLTWNEVPDAAYYYIYRGQSNQGAIAFSFLANISSSTSYQDLNVETYKVYYYKISAVDVYGNEGSVSYSLGVSIINELDYKKEIFDLVTELNALKNETVKSENDLKEKNELIAKASVVWNDLGFFNDYLTLLSLSEIETINNVKYLMNNYENKTLDELKSMTFQLDYNLKTYLKNYKKSVTVKTLNTTIGSLNITSIINESLLEINGNKYYKYNITNIILNPSNNLVKNINITFKVPQGAEIEGFEIINSTIIHSLNSLDSLSSQTLSYSFLSLSSYSNNITAQMLEVEMPKSITAYQVLNESKDTTIIGLSIWGLTLILSISLLFQYKNYHINFKNRQNSN